MAAKTRHRWPLCRTSGKHRYRLHADAIEALHQIQWQKDEARFWGVPTSRRECRTYKCPSCGGYHLTSASERPLATAA